jgi:branched-chain amino acid transport system substrate-binding protein
MNTVSRQPLRHLIDSQRALVRRLALTPLLVLAFYGLSALAADPINVGRSLALTGPLAAYGEAKRDGGDAYIESVNKAGGINGRKIVLTTIDDAYDPKKTVANIRELAATKRPAAFLGLFGVPTVAAAMPVIEELRIPTVGLTSGSPMLRAPHKRYIFPVRASYADEAAFIAKHMKTMSLNSIAIIRQDNPFGELVRDTMLKAALENGIAVVIDTKIAANGSDAASAVAAAQASKPEAIFLAMLSNAAIPTMRAIKASKASNLSLYAFSPVDASLLTKELGSEAGGLGITQVVPMPTSNQTRIATEYASALRALGRGEPSFYGLEAFIEAKVLVAAMRRAGNKASDPAALTSALEAQAEMEMGGYSVHYANGNHRGGKFLELTLISSRGTMVR